MDLARRVLTLDHLSEGRFLFGVGTGGGKEWEYNTLGIPFEGRVGRCNEALDMLEATRKRPARHVTIMIG